MGKWSSILKAGRHIVNNPGTRSLGSAVAHPQRTLAGAGQAIKTATVGAGVGYVGWQALVNDKPVVRTVADVAIGSGNVDTVVDTTSSAVDSVQSVVSEVHDSVTGLNGAVAQANSTFGGVSDFLRNVTSGHGADMFGGFFNNLIGGNVSGLGIVGLLAAGLLMFGRFGWLGKIGGALLAMMLISNNSRTAQQTQTTQAPLPATRHR